MKWLNIYILTFVFSTCQELTITENGFIQEQPKVQKAITVKLDGINRKSVYTPTVEFNFFINKPEGINPYPNYSFYKKTKDDTLLIDLPEGEYFARLDIQDNRFYPPFYSEFSGLHFYFGDIPIGRGNPILNKKDKCMVDPNSASDPNGNIRIIYCPKIKINPDTKYNFNFKIASQTEINYAATGGIYGIAFIISVRSYSPAGLGVFLITGFVNRERKITHSLENLEVFSSDKMIYQ